MSELDGSHSDVKDWIKGNEMRNYDQKWGRPRHRRSMTNEVLRKVNLRILDSNEDRFFTKRTLHNEMQYHVITDIAADGKEVTTQQIDHKGKPIGEEVTSSIELFESERLTPMQTDQDSEIFYASKYPRQNSHLVHDSDYSGGQNEFKSALRFENDKPVPFRMSVKGHGEVPARITGVEGKGAGTKVAIELLIDGEIIKNKPLLQKVLNTKPIYCEFAGEEIDDVISGKPKVQWITGGNQQTAGASCLAFGKGIEQMQQVSAVTKQPTSQDMSGLG